MANHPSADKRNRQSVGRTARNRAVRSALRTAAKKARTAISEGSPEAQEVVKAFCVHLAKAAGKGVIHANTAARSASRITKALNSARS